MSNKAYEAQKSAGAGLMGRLAAAAGAAALLVAAAAIPGTALAGSDEPTFRLALRDCDRIGAVKIAVRNFLRDAGYVDPWNWSLAGASIGTPDQSGNIWSVPVRFFRGKMGAGHGAIFIDCNTREVSASESIETLAGLPPAPSDTEMRFAQSGR